MTLDRRRLLAVLAAAAFAPAVARAEETILDQPVQGRTCKVTVWSPQAPQSLKGVVVFSHGGSSSPAPYADTAAWLTAAGYAVYAPLHTDSATLPDDQRKALQAAFGDRIADLATVTGYVAQRHAGLPIVAMGHSYGSLFALMLGGAMEYVAKVYNPAVNAVVCWSSPGPIPGLTTPAAFQTLKVPLLMITGDKDLVPGFVTDWRQHELPFEGTGIAESYELVFAGGEHTLIRGPQAPLARQVTLDFLNRELFAAPAALKLPAGAPATLKTKAAG